MPKAYTEWTVHPHGPITKLTENLWWVEGSLPRMPIKRVMTVVRLADGRLAIHSAVALDEDGMRAIEAWGRPDLLFVPNRAHRTDAPAYKKRYPALRVFCPAAARPQVEEVVPVDGTYANFVPTAELALEHLAGVAEGEGVMRVRSTDGVTLVFNDTIFNLPHGKGFSGWLFRTLGSTGGPRVTPIGKFFFVKDRAALRRDLERLADTPDLKRVVVSHGAVIAHEPARVLREVAAAL